MGPKRSQCPQQPRVSKVGSGILTQQQIGSGGGARQLEVSGGTTHQKRREAPIQQRLQVRGSNQQRLALVQQWEALSQEWRASIQQEAASVGRAPQKLQM